MVPAPPIYRAPWNQENILYRALGISDYNVNNVVNLLSRLRDRLLFPRSIFNFMEIFNNFKFVTLFRE